MKRNVTLYYTIYFLVNGRWKGRCLKSSHTTVENALKKFESVKKSFPACKLKRDGIRENGKEVKL